MTRSGNQAISLTRESYWEASETYSKSIMGFLLQKLKKRRIASQSLWTTPKMDVNARKIITGNWKPDIFHCEPLSQQQPLGGDKVTLPLGFQNKSPFIQKRMQVILQSVTVSAHRHFVKCYFIYFLFLNEPLWSFLHSSILGYQKTAVFENIVANSGLSPIRDSATSWWGH